MMPWCKNARISAMVVAFIVAVSWPAAYALDTNPNIDQEWIGRIDYTRISDGSYRGEEHWRLTRHPDGSQTIRMTVRLDDTEVLRDVVLRVDGALKPIDSYQTLWTAGEHRGSGYYWLEGNRLNAVLTGPQGTLTQSAEVPDQFSFVSHPLAADGWHFWYYDWDQAGVQSATVYNTDTLGLTVGSILARVHETPVEFLGNEVIDVPAGTFSTWRFLMDGRLEIWVDREHFFMVRMTNTSRDRLYELGHLAPAYSE